MMINKEDIKGYNTTEGMFCTDCLPDEYEVKEDDILTKLDEDTEYFCDKCGENLR